MTAADLTAWRTALGISRAEASRRLGCAENSLAAYEAGKTRIPRYIALACAALAYGLPPWRP